MSVLNYSEETESGTIACDAKDCPTRSPFWRNQPMGWTSHFSPNRETHVDFCPKHAQEVWAFLMTLVQR